MSKFGSFQPISADVPLLHTATFHGSDKLS